MTKEFAVHSDTVAVEVYMADRNPPTLHDFYVTRAGDIRRTVDTVGIPGVIQVVMAGSHPTSMQILKVRRRFEIDQRCQLLRFY